MDYSMEEMFQEPEGFRPSSPKPTQLLFSRKKEFVTNGPLEFVIHLAPKHSLWGHRLSNASKSMANYLDEFKDLYIGKHVLELGAASSIPSIICALNGAKYCLSTDYPDPSLINNIQLNAQEIIPDLVAQQVFEVKGFRWGQKEQELDSPLLSRGAFDLILLSDVIFNHNQHVQLVQSCLQYLQKDGIVYCTFTHHVVKWIDRDLNFFKIAAEFGFTCELIYKQCWEPLFPEDEGNEEIRSTVYGYKLYLQ
jgi:nicotinamide N-methyltransferase